MVGKDGNGLLGAGRGADQNAMVVGQMLMQKSGDFPGLLDTLRGEFACVVGCAIYRFCMPPQDQIHHNPQYYILFISR
jgi:hypothetical protein